MLFCTVGQSHSYFQTALFPRHSFNARVSSFHHNCLLFSTGEERSPSHLPQRTHSTEIHFLKNYFNHGGGLKFDITHGGEPNRYTSYGEGVNRYTSHDGKFNRFTSYDGGWLCICYRSRSCPAMSMRMRVWWWRGEWKTLCLVEVFIWGNFFGKINED